MNAEAPLREYQGSSPHNPERNGDCGHLESLRLEREAVVSDRNYHLRRERQERQAADASSDPAARSIHRRLGDRHSRRAASLGETERLMTSPDERHA